MYKEDLALNNLQWLICYKTQPNKNYIGKLFFYYLKAIGKNLVLCESLFIKNDPIL